MEKIITTDEFIFKSPFNISAQSCKR